MLGIFLHALSGFGQLGPVKHRRRGLHSARPAWKATRTSGQSRSSGYHHQMTSSNFVIEDEGQVVSLTWSPHQWGQGACRVRCLMCQPDTLTWLQWHQPGRYMCAGLWAVTAMWEAGLGQSQVMVMTTMQQHYPAYHAGAVCNEH